MLKANRPLGGVVLVVFFTAVHAQELRLDKYDHQPQKITRIRVASAAIVPEKWDREANWKRIEAAVTKAAKQMAAQVVVTPEGVLEGYVINEVNAEKDPERRALLVKKFLELGEPLDGPYVRQACSLSKKLGVYLVLGFLERREERLYNTVILIDPAGDIVGRYAKTHFAQGYTVNPTCYRPGEQYPVFDTEFGKVGMLICYDRQLPEPARILALKGAQMLLVPSYGSYTDKDGWNTVLLRTRAYENRMPLVFAHPYQSLLIGDRGDIKAMGKAGEITVFEVDTSPARTRGRFRNRRPETYSRLVEEPKPGN